MRIDADEAIFLAAIVEIFRDLDLEDPLAVLVGDGGYWEADGFDWPAVEDLELRREIVGEMLERLGKRLDHAARAAYAKPPTPPPASYCADDLVPDRDPPEGWEP